MMANKASFFSTFCRSPKGAGSLPLLALWVAGVFCVAVPVYGQVVPKITRPGTPAERGGVLGARGLKKEGTSEGTPSSKRAPAEESPPLARVPNKVPAVTLPTKGAKTAAKWTVLVYLAADCDLEDAMLGNIEELAQIGSTKDVNILVLADRSPLGDEPATEEADSTEEEKVAEADSTAEDDSATDEEAAEEDTTAEDTDGYTNRDVLNLANWSGAKLLFVEEGHLRELQDWGETDMGSAATLEKFVQTAQTNFPAEHFILVVSDHGSGWQGVCHDDSSDNFINTPALAKTISKTFSVGKKLDVLGFDCCLMGNLEVAQAVSKEVKLFVGSEELIPGTGWNYVSWARLLKKKPLTTPLELCEAMADTYRDYFSKADRESAAGLTLSVIDVAKLAELESAVAALAKGLSGKLSTSASESWRQIARAHAHSTIFSSDLIDIGHFCRNLQDESSDETINALAGDVLAALHQAVLHNVVGSRQAEAHGLTLYFPVTLDETSHQVSTSYRDLRFASSEWAKFLALFSAQGDKEEFTPILTAVKTTSATVDEMRTADITSSLDVENASHVDFVLARREGEGLSILSRIQTASDEEGVLSDLVSAQWPALVIGEEMVVCPILRQTAAEPESEEEEAGGIYLEVPVQARRHGTKKWLPITLVFEAVADGEEGLGEYLYAVVEDKNGVQDFEFRKGDQIRMVQTKVTRKGKVIESGDTTSPPITIQNPKAFGLGVGALGEGEYQVGYLAQNLHEVAESGLVAITVKSK